jgi:hypothetical protein
MKHLQFPVTSSLFGPNILLSTLISKVFNLYSLGVGDQVSHPYKRTGNITVLYRPILIIGGELLLKWCLEEYLEKVWTG